MSKELIRKLESMGRRLYNHALIDTQLRYDLDKWISHIDTLHQRVETLQADIAQLIQHEAERLFAPNEIWWEKKIFLAGDPTTAALDFAAFREYLIKKFKANRVDLLEWSMLAATVECAL